VCVCVDSHRGLRTEHGTYNPNLTPFSPCQVHPDRNKAAGAQEAMVRLGLAYHALSDGGRRRDCELGH